MNPARNITAAIVHNCWVMTCWCVRRPNTMSEANSPNTEPEAPIVGAPVARFESTKPTTPATT